MKKNIIHMILKLGSRGPMVKRLQEFLNRSKFKVASSGPGSPGKETELFGPATDAAVKAWQKENKLTPDGEVGPKTWEQLGLATTDISENSELIQLDIKESFLPKNEYFQGPTKKEWVFLHHTAGWHNPFNVITSWGKDTRGQIATEFVLGGPSIRGNDFESDGVLVQAFHKGGYGWHLGVGNTAMHRNSVGIELCNFGYLTKGGYHKWDAVQKKNVWVALKPEVFYTYVGTEAAASQIVTLKKEFRGYRTWHKYSNLQVEILKKWILYIADRDGIDVRKGLPELIKKRGIEAFDICDITMCEKEKGLWLHTNLQRGKFDLFPQDEIVEMLTSL